MIRTGGPNVFVSSMWRSGSTHIAYGLASLFNWRPASTAGMHGEGMEQHVINAFNAAILFPYGYQVFHQHSWGTPRNVGLLLGFKIRPIICVRNVFDILVSLKDRIDLLWPNVVIPGLMLPAGWAEMDDTQKYHWLAYHATPWLLQFYGSWQSQKTVDTKIVHYEEFFADQVSGFREIIKWLGMVPPADRDIEKASKKKFNLHKGVSGRGSQMPGSARGIVYSIADTYGKDAFRDVLCSES